MDDTQIVDLYFARSEMAIKETDNKYGGYCYKIAYSILANREDSEESVSDAYLSAWNIIPPRKPVKLSTFLGKLTRNISIFDGTPYYLKAIAKEMIHCYDVGQYNATLVLMRKLVETLIVECFERYGIDSEIKDPNGVFFYLSDLIPKYLASSKWNASRNINTSLTSVKKYGDLSAHNRRFLAKKGDIDSFKFELRQALQEIILTIDYQNWNKSK